MRTLYFTSIVVLFLFFYSCTEKVVRQTVFSQDSIPTQNFEISLDRDTVLKTAGGALLDIPKGTFTSNSKKTIVLDVKEAYDPEMMLRGGLATEAKNGPLSSGGMIYVGSKDSAEYNFEGKIKISIPTVAVNPLMSVFKGKIEEDGKVSWEDQTPLQNSENPVYAKGKELFEGNCTSCHAVGKVKVGPDLAYIGERRERKWLHAFTRNSQRVIKGVMNEGSYSSSEIDRYAICLYSYYNGTEMTSFPSFKDEELDAIYYFLDQYSYRNKIVCPDDKLYKSVDSCGVYYQKLQELESLNNQRGNMIKGNEPHIQRNKEKDVIRQTPSTPIAPATIAPPDKDKVEKYSDQPEYYQIEINTLGWYNIDIFLKNLPEVEKCNLQVTLDGSIDQSQVYFIVPDYNVVLNGGLMKDGKTVAFDEVDGSVPLPVGKQAHILSIRESAEGLWFARHSFTIKKQDRISLTSALIKPAAVEEEIRKMNIKDFSLQIKESTNAKAIREMDKQLDLKTEEIEKLRPKNYDCDCSFPENDRTAVVVDSVIVSSINVESAKEGKRRITF